MKKFLLLFLITATCFALNAQVTCNPAGNVVLYSNYDGGVLNINVDVNIPNLKIGVVSYEPVTINLTGAFVNNITAAQFAGYVTTTNHHCSNTPVQTSIVGAPAGTDTLIFMPTSPVTNPNGYYIIICNYSCDTVTNQGGCNTPDQIAAYFQQQFGGLLRYHFTQYGCWNGTYNVSNGGNCCVGASAVVQPPSVALQSSDTSFCEKNCIDFTDLSTNNPTSWQWLFPGADTTTSTLQNPTGICYSNYGSFDVTLIACNSGGCDTIVLNNFINEYPNPSDSIWGANDTLFSLPAITYQWYEVSAGLIPGATNQNYIPTQMGSYYCVVTDSIGCVATSNTMVLTAGPPAPRTGEFTVYPNPNDGNFEISFGINSANGGQGAVFIYNAIGQLVFHSPLTKTHSLLTTSLKDGIYFVELITGEKVYRKKMVIKQ